MELKIYNMIKELEKIRSDLFAVIRSGERKNRRALLIAYKHIDKAVRALGAGKQAVPPREGAKQEAKYDAQPKEEEAQDTGPYLANNIPEPTGPERPRRKSKKP